MEPNKTKCNSYRASFETMTVVRRPSLALCETRSSTQQVPERWTRTAIIVAMAAALLGSLAPGETVVNGWESVATSYPDFAAHLEMVA